MAVQLHERVYGIGRVPDQLRRRNDGVRCVRSPVAAARRRLGTASQAQGQDQLTVDVAARRGGDRRSPHYLSCRDWCERQESNLHSRSHGFTARFPRHMVRSHRMGGENRTLAARFWRPAGYACAHPFGVLVVGMRGLEPRLPGPKPGVMPFHYIPSAG